MIERLSTLSTEYSLGGICGLPGGLGFALDGFRILYVCIATFMWIVSLLFSLEYISHYERKSRYYVFLILTYFATVGVFLSADLYTMFIFFEIMSLASYVWVAFDERKESLRAADTYLAVSVIGGLTMLMGLFLIYDATGNMMMHTLKLSDLRYLYMTAGSFGFDAECKKIWAGGICMLVGFGAKAGAFPLHIWLPKAHPVAPAPASALLSGILTKTGILGILMLSTYIFGLDKEWSVLILYLGICTMVAGAVPALFAVDIKRTLACSSVSQIGFIMTGIGIGGLYGETGYAGAVLHMVGHSIFKLILFSVAGVIFMNIHKLDLDSVRGFGRKKPLLHLIFLSGAAGIAGVPGFNGYISKTLIHEAMVEAQTVLAYMEANGSPIPILPDTVGIMEWIFIISGGCTLAYMLKLYICIFIEKNTDLTLQSTYDEKRRYMTNTTGGALLTAAVIPPVLGLSARVSMNGIAGMAREFLGIEPASEYVLNEYFIWECLKGGLISIVIGVVIYFGIIRVLMLDKESHYSDPIPKWLDLEDLVYRPVLLRVLPFLSGIVCRVMDTAVDITIVVLRKTLFKDNKQKEELKEGIWLTFILGRIANSYADMREKLYALRGKKIKKHGDFVHRFALDYESIRESRSVIYRSLSFGLLLFCMGLVMTVAYILITRWFI